MEAIETCHTSSKRGLTEPAREALVRTFVCFINLFLSDHEGNQFMSFEHWVSFLYKHVVICLPQIIATCSNSNVADGHIN